MAQITENNEQYYSGSQTFFDASSATTTFQTTFNTDLVFYSHDPSNINYPLNNFKLYTSPDGQTWTEYTSSFSVTTNKITTGSSIPAGTYVAVQLKRLDGGEYADQNAFGNTTENNYGSYQYIPLKEIIDNFMVAYVGDGKLIQTVKKTDILFHAKRGLQEFSYDTLKSIKSQELSVPHNLSVILPQDYVNYVRLSWIDDLGVRRIIQPTRLTKRPSEAPIQSGNGIPLQDNFSSNIEGTSQINERWANADTKKITGQFSSTELDNGYNVLGFESGYYLDAYGKRYGLNPETTQTNGWFVIDETQGKVSFSSDLVDKLILFEYISDGLAYDRDTKVPKLAEEALYKYILYNVIYTRANQPEYLVQRLKRDKSAALRNTKIRLSNIKLEEISQVFRNKAKWIKH